ncbi:ATP-dependent RNA helicase DDX1-like isoform X3 [Trematomus bernacchii]|uniref:ATP-dependent RNA helicase DDX1-like isoform X3 n=1 Tax=Trematomus bernacchii TaxID=40690 RepID=UPI00146DA214|nr:ATP-dependent RNA helicase DDX1-like isoform X3 [Trematomus bernacchii]
MGLAISLVAMEKEKVWYHVCANRGRGCYNTRLKEDGGCTIWYKEKELLSDIEEHLKCTVTQCEPDIKVVTTRVTWMLWHQRSWNWLTSRGKPNLPSSTWDTCQTSFSEPSEHAPTSTKTVQIKEMLQQETEYL